MYSVMSYDFHKNSFVHFSPGYAQPAAVPTAAATAVAHQHQPSPVPATGYNAYGQPIQAAAPAAQPAPAANGYA